MANQQIFVIGCGIAGPVLAIFLKIKGYNPVLFERTEELTEVGVSLMLQANGLKLLNLIPGLLPQIPGQSVERMVSYSNVLNELLGESDLPTKLPSKYGFGMIGVSRPAFHRLLVETAESHGIPIHWGHQFISLEQHDDHVFATFANGIVDKAHFVIGCDGLHSNTRISLFGKEVPNFTGLVQTGGYSPTPTAMAVKPSMTDVFDVKMHMITYQTSANHSSWAITSAESEAKESWRAIDENQKAEFQAGPCGKWAFGAGELIKTAEKIVKYGLYDRPELKTWHQGRVVLLGDAAHPTTPHLGQGANQAFEDIYHFIRILTARHPDPSTPLSTELLKTIFSDYESVRIPRTAGLVAAARERGKQRVVPDLESAKHRDEMVRRTMANPEALAAGYDSIASGPFIVSEI